MTLKIIDDKIDLGKTALMTIDKYINLGELMTTEQIESAKEVINLLIYAQCRDLPGEGEIINKINTWEEDMANTPDLDKRFRKWEDAQRILAQAILELLTLPRGKAGQSGSEGLRGGGK